MTAAGLSASALLAPVLVLAPAATLPAAAAHPLVPAAARPVPGAAVAGSGARRSPVGGGARQATPGAAARTVKPRVEEQPLAGLDRAALGALRRADRPAPAAHRNPGSGGAPAALRLAGPRTVVLTAARSARRFALLGVTWDHADAGLGVDVKVRTRSGGRWTGWTDLGGLDDVAADDGSRDARAGAQRAGTAPLWTGSADGVQVRVDAPRTPRALRLQLIDPGTSPADAGARSVTSRATAAGDPPAPPIVTRARWGADESLVRSAPEYAEPVSVAFVHHTDSTNTYTRAQSAALVRGIFAYHVRSRGWNDIGYNFLVDRYGTVFEGRGGGIDRGVVGAHTGGFNAHSFAASLLGSFGSVAPPPAMTRGLTRLLAWKLGLSYLSPTGTGQLLNHGFSGARYPTGQTVTFPTVAGHRDADTTSCPGNRAYGALPALRRAVRAAMGPALVAPSVDATTRAMLDSAGFTVRAGAVNPLTWRLTVSDATTGTPLRVVTPASAAPVTAVQATWDRRDANGAPVPPGAYVLRLDAGAHGRRARAWTATVAVTSPVTVDAPPTAPYDTDVSVGGHAPAGSAVLLESRPATGGDWSVLAQPTADAAGGWSATVHLVRDLQLRATADGVASPVVSLAVAPTAAVASGAQTYGQPVTITGTALPGDAVQLRLSAPGLPARVAAATADGTGAWNAQVDGVADWTVLPVAHGVAGRAVPVVLTPTLQGEAVTAVPLGRVVRVAGTAASRGPVDVETRRDGAGWVRVATTTTGGDGRWAAPLTVRDDVDVRATHRGLSSGATRRLLVALTAEAPASAAWHGLVTLRGTARPGHDLVATLASADGTTAASTVTPGRDGRWSAPFRLDGQVAWSVTQDGRPAVGGSTAVAPTAALPAGPAVVAHPLALSGTFRPGVGVDVRLRTAAGEVALGSAVPDTNGAWVLPVDTDRVVAGTLVATAEGISASTPLAVVAATTRAPAAAPLGAGVQATGVARPGTRVVPQLQRHGATGWTSLPAVDAGADGRWSVRFRLPDDTSVRGLTPDGASAPALVRVAPTLTAPARARRGQLARLGGIARPRATVVVLRQEAGRPRVALAYTRADARGRWWLSVRTRGWAAYTARSGGVDSPTRAVRAV